MTTDSPTDGRSSAVATTERYGIPDTPSDAILDGIAQAAANLCEVPFALIDLVDSKGQRSRTCIGMSKPRTCPDLTLLSNIISQRSEFVEIKDTHQVTGFRNSSLASSAPDVRFCAGSPLSNGKLSEVFGTLCVVDYEPRKLSIAQRDGLAHLAQVITELVTERRRSAIAAIDQVLEQAVGQSVLITDPNLPDNPVTYINRAFEVMTGYSQDDLLGKDCRVLQGKDTDDIAVAQLYNAIKAHEPCTVVMKNYRKDGTMFWNEISISPIKDDSGKTINFVGIQNDVTDRQNAQEHKIKLAEATARMEKARASNSQLAQIVEDSLNEIYVVDADSFTIVVANRAAREHLGYTSEELQQMMPWDVVVDLTPDNICEITLPFKSGDLNELIVELVHRRKDGSTYPVSTHLQFMASQTPPVYTAISHDISDRRHQEELINLLNRAIEAVDVGVSITDVSQNNHPLVYVNQALCSLTGYSRDDLIGHSLHVLQRGNEHQPEERKIQEALAKGDPIHIVTECMRQDGSNYMAELALFPVCNAHGTTTNYIGIRRDITVKLEQEARSHETRKIEAIGRLSGGIAHDFNNLLSVISGNLELLDIDITNENQRGYLNEARFAADMGARLTRRLLTFARQRRLDPVVLNANDLIIDTIELLRSTIGETITLSSGLASDLWTIQADPSEFENTVINLTINARDSMPGGGTIKVETRNVHFTENNAEHGILILPGDYIRFTVTDTGSGMTEEVRARIFEPFFTTKEPDKGTGMGMATVHGFVHQSGGHIDIHSEPGRGTVVSLYLPKYLEATPVRTETRATKVNPSETDALILVVEDNDMVRELTVNQLELLQFTIKQASNGTEAIRQLKNNPDIDLVLSDIVMSGGMTGYDVARWAWEHRPDVKVLLTSGYSEQQVENNADQIRTLQVLYKPYSLIDLQQAIVASLEHREEST